MTAPEIITIGNVNCDIILGPQAPWPTPGTEVVLEHSALREGGAAGNTALALRALGCRQRLLCNMGMDFMGDWLRSHFGELAIDWTPSPLPTSFSVGITHPDGERTFFSNRGHVAGLSLSDVVDHLTPATIRGAMILFTGGFLTPNLAAEYPGLFERLRAQGARIALDTGWPSEGWSPEIRDRARTWVAQSDRLLLNELEICGMTGVAAGEIKTALHRLREIMPEGGRVIAKLGHEGAVALDESGRRLRVPAPLVQVVDTIGAGDCFNAGYLWAETRGYDLELSVRIGVEVASGAISTAPREYAAPTSSHARM
jgi:sugar/nucleoside kinase (ribokinase family)